MLFFPVPHTAPLRPPPSTTIVRGNAQNAVQLQPEAITPKPSLPVLPKELERLVQQTSVPPTVAEAEELSLPSMTQMAKNVLGSLKKVAAGIGQGIKLPKEEAEARLTICRTCPFFRHVDERCSKCGCYMAVKTYLRAEHCPVGKW